MNNIVNLQDFRKKKDPDIVHIGSIIEWRDIDGTLKCSKVKEIIHASASDFKSDVPAIFTVLEADLKNKQDYHFVTDSGMTMVGDIVVSKVVKTGINELRNTSIKG